MTSFILESLVSRTGAVGWTESTLEVKNYHAHVIMQDICNKFIDIEFSVVSMVSDKAASKGLISFSQP